ncbi:rhodanese-like domain-containing protein [Alkalicoccus luteus]|uniref:Rhodanese-like domain-containing protein n=1 Tax=Alkalicoccus luteus TaxID=1237094 RepID=A0A969PPZ2_9BACI|nr:rhodanese-like domain-containing protein [Alkalicoccus luteus]NJP36839.1 rhodanese-like domain-containing protein [Alkalicoccus luteus]
MSYEQDGIKQVDKEELKQILEQKSPNQIVIDVREPEEYTKRHIPGVPLLPMMSIPELADGIDKEKEYVFVCRSGNRSQKVSLFLKGQGYENVANYEGGMLEWDGDEADGDEVHLQSVDELKSWKNS